MIGAYSLWDLLSALGGLALLVPWAGNPDIGTKTERWTCGAILL